jgi:hypothetical protein
MTRRALTSSKACAHDDGAMRTARASSTFVMASLTQDGRPLD